MSYTLGNVDSSSFNSTKYPGTCKPSNTAALAIFKELQQQLNRVAQIKNLPKIAVDGDIGPGTIALAGYVKAVAAADATGSGDLADFANDVVSSINASSCTALASNADNIAANVKMYATQLGVPAAVAAPVNTKPTVLVSSSGQETQVASAVENTLASGAFSFGALGTVEKVVVVGALGVAGWIVFGGKKKRRRG